jgi:Tfp pilus assembly protein, pilus retraction ATPase PilT
MTNIKNYLKMMLDRNASDMFFRAGSNVRLRIDGEVVSIDERVITLDEVNEAVKELTSNELKDFFQRTLDVDFGVYVPELDNRFRISIFMQRNWPALVVRSIRSAIQTFEELHLPSDILSRLPWRKEG